MSASEPRARVNPPPPVTEPSPWRLSVAPMMDWTDRHCRYFHRLLSKKARLYTEMVTTGALIHGDQARHLDYYFQEHPLALQLGGSEPHDLAQCARLAQAWGYAEVNLNCGCPSERVQRGAFGACLMNEPVLVADCIKAMQDAVSLEVTVKHRIGIDQNENYDFVRDFVGQLAHAGCRVFIVHARNAWLKGLSPKENREIPPLRYAVVRKLKQDFPHLTIVVNGGITTTQQIENLLQACPDTGPALDGVMVGREAYHKPWWLSEWDALSGAAHPVPLDRQQIEDQMVAYCESTGAYWPQVVRHMLGLYHGQAGARLWRQVLSDHHLRDMPVKAVFERAFSARTSSVARSA
jgi:tRNA-dihydrouridine synthase A